MQRRWSEIERFLKLRCVPLRGHIDDKLANVVIAQLLYLASEDDRAPITMLIDSDGGVVTSSLAIVDTIRDVAPAVRTCAWGRCAGAAALILAAGAIGQRSCVRGSRPAVVPLWSRSDAVDRKAALEIERLIARQTEILLACTQLTPEIIARAFEVGIVFTSDDARELGLVDDVIDASSVAAEIRTLWLSE